MSFLLPENKYYNVEEYKDEPNLRTYHSGLRLLDDGLYVVEGYRGATLLDEHTELPAIVEFALNTNGVLWVRLNAYTLSIRKSPMFKWEDIESKLLVLWIGIMEAMDLDAAFKLPDQRPDPKETK